MSGFFGDLRFAVRMLGKHPALTGIAVAALALGIGLTTIMFSIVYGAILRGLPFESPEEIIHVERTNLEAGIEGMEVTVHDYVDWRERQRSFEDLAAFYSGTINVSGTERAERFDGGFMTANSFTLLGVQPVRGRLFRDEDNRPGAAPVVLLGYDLWRDRYGSDDGIVGRAVRVNGEQRTVIGVMPEAFRFPFDQQIWVPLTVDPLSSERGEGTTLEVFGRLRDGVSSDAALADLAAVAAQLALDYPDSNEGVGVTIQPFTREFVGDEAVALLFTMLGAVFLVLIIACANVANLLLARAALRGKEVAVRSALGATRRRVMMQMLTEALVLAAIGGALGIGLAYVGIGVFRDVIAVADPPFWMQFGLLPPVLIFVAGVTVFAAVVAGVMPAVQASGTDINAILKDESRGSSGMRIGRLSRGLVMLEIALSVALLSAAGLMVKSVTNLRTTDFGFDRENVFTARLGLFETVYPDVDARRRFFADLQERLATVPDAEAATLTTSLPGVGACCWRITPEGQTFDRDQDYPLAARVATMPGFMETFGIAVRSGRSIERQDGPDALPVAVVNDVFERAFFPDGAVGKRVRVGTADSEEPWRTIVGVVGSRFMGGIGNGENADRPGIYVPLAQDDARFVSLAVRTRGNPMEATAGVRSVVESVDSDLPLYFVQTMDDAIRLNTWFYDIFGSLFIIFGAAALFLASIGLYGVMSFAASRRTQEVGIRMALGAQPGDVVRMIVRQGLLQIGIGVTVGLVLAFGLSRLLQTLLFEVSPNDPLILATIVGILTISGLLASFIPARRASRVDPMVAFRYE